MFLLAIFGSMDSLFITALFISLSVISPSARDTADTPFEIVEHKAAPPTRQLPPVNQVDRGLDCLGLFGFACS